MTAELKNKIESIDVAEPYVWRLRLTEDDFLELEETVKTVERAALLTPQWAKTVIAYIAEWYKRRYDAKTKEDILKLDSKELKTIWENSGIDTNRYVYTDKADNNRWKYSMYVLGGLSIHLEGGNVGTLKRLWRMYYSNGEDFDNEKIMDDFGDETKAASFRESIKRHHSLYHYLQKILNGNLPFSQGELSDPHSDVSRFVEAIKKANDEARLPKFRFEWRIINFPDSCYFVRKLRVCLQPEEKGELHEYLSFERAESWGIPNPTNVKILSLALRFVCENKIVAPDWENPLITYVNTGDYNTGFIALNASRHKDCSALPPQKFTKLEVVVRNVENKKEYVVQEETKLYKEYMQLWRVSPDNYHWSSKKNSQHETAILFSSPWQLKSQSEDKDINHEVVTKRFKDMPSGEALPWNWYNIHDTATLYDGKESIPFSNRQGEFTISNRIYDNTICYVSDGRIKFFEGIEDEEDFEELPLIFKKEDIIVHHFKKKDDNAKTQEETYDIEEIVADKIEFKNGDRYISWTQDKAPLYGKLILRITIKGQEKPIQMCYLPPFSDDQPIVRDFDNARILYKTYNEVNALVDGVEQDEITKNNVPLIHTRTINIGNTNGYAEIDVWRPTLLKEVIFDQRLIQYLDEGEQLDLPYIFKNRVAINDFSREGFWHYDCSSLRTIYTGKYLDFKKHPMCCKAAWIAWGANIMWRANMRRLAEPDKLLDSYAPEFLYICFGKSPNEKTPPANCHFYSWNYSDKQKPLLCNEYETPPKRGIVFQDLSQNKDLSCYYPKINDDVWSDEVQESQIECFKVATRCGIYYFEMEPLRRIKKKEEYVKEIYEPLCQERNGHLTEEDRNGLYRFAEEFGFSWQDFDINIDKE